MEILFLGTGGMQPTKDRGPSSILISHRGENILLDCGEGTQRQMQIAKIFPTKVTKIFISHWHGDHVFGLPGFLQTLKSSEYSKTLEIYGPKGTKKFIKVLFKSFIPKSKMKLKIKEIKKEGLFFENKDLEISSIKLNHSVPCLGYIIKEKDRRKMNLKYLKKFGLTKDPILKKLQDGKNIKYKGQKILVKNSTNLIKGKKISIILDTSYFSRISKAVKNSDILITEASYLSNLKEKAKNYKHLTVSEAAKIAKQGNVKQLILTHIGKRYGSSSPLLKEAKKTFKNTKVAKDFMKV